MNEYERKMLNILRTGKEHLGMVATKAEFEAEGTRVDELLRLSDITHKADVGLALKLGGCEAVRDLLEGKQLGVRYMIAPMVETPYALSKYVAAKERVFSENERQCTDFLFNLETKTAYENYRELVALAAERPGVDGVVFGRVDYCFSLGMGRDRIETEEVTHGVCNVGALCKQKGLDFVVGGAVSHATLPNLRIIYRTMLTRFETRKIVFSADVLQQRDVGRALRDAVHFELMWLINKREYYGSIQREDTARIDMLKDRWEQLKDRP